MKRGIRLQQVWSKAVLFEANSSIVAVVLFEFFWKQIVTLLAVLFGLLIFCIIGIRQIVCQHCRFDIVEGTGDTFDFATLFFFASTIINFKDRSLKISTSKKQLAQVGKLPFSLSLMRKIRSQRWRRWRFRFQCWYQFISCTMVNFEDRSLRITALEHHIAQVGKLPFPMLLMGWSKLICSRWWCWWRFRRYRCEV